MGSDTSSLGGRPSDEFEAAPSQQRETAASFKAALNEFRRTRPNSSFDALEKTLARKHREFAVGKTAMNDATRVDRPLPSPRTVRAMIMALTDNSTVADTWVLRLTCLEGATEQTAAEPPHPTVNTSDAGRQRGLRSRIGSRRFLIAAVCVLVVVVASNAITFYLARSNSNTAGDATVRTGDNPLHTVCTRDAEVAASSNEPALLLEIIYSPTCDAEWARVTRRIGVDGGNTITATIYRRAEPDGPSRQHAVEPDAHSAFTTLIVRNDPTDRLCGTASVTNGRETINAAAPLCI